MSMLRTSGLAKTYGMNDTAVKALKPTDLEIKKGEFVAIVGPSGSGKSTLLHLLAGLDKPSAGKVFINDQDIYELSENELSRYRRQNIGFIFQAFNLIPILSAEENIKLPILMDGKKVDEGYIDELMDVLDIKERRKHLPGELSGGQQQRVSIARALANKPSVIFADEPTGNLDSKNSKEVLQLLKSTIEKYNQTLIMITHDDSIAQMADRIITISDGMIVEEK
ncbi:ABC transporter ATP-binding protein [Clostridium sp.]|uniref:ABC transporter ATP-binding protein n=1 Tax=Clostridium sp. TaxID=1506 RepID=UPI0032179266